MPCSAACGLPIMGTWCSTRPPLARPAGSARRGCPGWACPGLARTSPRLKPPPACPAGRSRRGSMGGVPPNSPPAPPCLKPRWDRVARPRPVPPLTIGRTGGDPVAGAVGRRRDRDQSGRDARRVRGVTARVPCVRGVAPSWAPSPGPAGVVAAAVIAVTSDAQSGTPTPIEASALTPAQLAGEQCVWCRDALHTATRCHVGWTGRPVVNLYGCQHCVVRLRRRLPSWPEPGSC